MSPSHPQGQKHIKLSSIYRFLDGINRLGKTGDKRREHEKIQIIMPKSADTVIL